MKFDWSEFTQKDFVNYCAKLENDTIIDGDYIGCVRVGELCFDLVVRCYDNKLTLDYDLHIGGIDDGYGYSRVDGTPYTEDGGGTFVDGIMIDCCYDKFKEVAEGAFTDFINNEGSSHGVSLIDKANKPLHIW